MANKNESVLIKIPSFLNLVFTKSNRTTVLYTSTIFTVIREEPASFCLVLDHSTSMMGDRITQLQAVAQNWILNDVANGSSVGIVRFE